MADITPRILHDNLATRAATVITSSSEQISLPRERLRYPTPTDVWRSGLGWNVGTHNLKLDFTEAGVARVATLTAGNYPTGALKAAMVQAAMNAAPGAVNTYTVAYDAGTKKYGINRATGAAALVLKFAAGAPNFDTSVHLDLGYTSTDKSPAGAAVATAEDASYKSREWVLFDFGSAQAFTVGIAHQHNLGTGSTVKLLAKATSDVLVSPTITKTLAGDDLATKRILFFAQETFRYALLLFEDTGNVEGYTELGVPFIGPYFQPARGFRMGRTRQGVNLTQIFPADEGALQKLVRSEPEQHSLSWGRMVRADFLAYRAIQRTRPHLFLAFDPQNYPGIETLYGAIQSTTIFEQAIDDAWYAGQSVFLEDLG